MKAQSIICVLAIALCTGSQAYSQDKVTQQVAGLVVMKVNPDAEYENSALVTGHESGTTVYIRVAIDSTKILSVGDGKFAIKVNDGEKFDEGELNSFYADISEDGKSVILPIKSQKLPPDGSTGLMVKGAVKLVVGREKKVDTLDIKLEKDAEFEFNGAKVKVNSVGDGFNGGKEIEFTTSKSWDAIESFQLLDGSGKQVECTRSGYSSWGFGDEMTYNYNYSFDADPEQITQAKIEFYSKTADVPVDIEHTVNLGLGK